MKESLVQFSSAYWRAFVDSDFTSPPEACAEDLVVVLLELIDSPDQWLRDTVAYGGLSALIERGEISDAQIVMVLEVSMQRLEPARMSSTSSYERSFSALLIASVLDYDNRGYWVLGEAGFHEVLNALCEWYLIEPDLRGYTEDGWLHALAHGADALLACSQSPYCDSANALSILDSIVSRLIKGRGWRFTFDEQERMAYAALSVLVRDDLSLARVTEILQVLNPFALAAPDDADYWICRLNIVEWLQAVLVQSFLGARPVPLGWSGSVFVKRPRPEPEVLARFQEVLYPFLSDFCLPPTGYLSPLAYREFS